MTIFQSECFLAVAEYLNFAKAAEQMNISQPAITRQIQVLESELNVKLFNRSTRSVKLTAEGCAFITDARTMVSASKRAIRRFTKQDEEKIVDFHIGCSSLSHMELLVSVLEALASTYPQIHPRLHIILGSQLLDAVDSETIDVALSCRSPKEKNSLIYRELKKVPYVCICRDDSPLASLQTVTASDLHPYPMIVYDPGSMTPEVIAGQWELAEDKSPSQLYLCETKEASMLLVGAGFGVTVIPEIYIPEHRNLCICPLKESTPVSFGIYHKANNKAPHLKTFVMLVKELFSAQSNQNQDKVKLENRS